MEAFDREAFRAAAKALVDSQRPLPVQIEGLGACWVKPLDAGDWVERQAAVRSFQDAGHTVSSRVVMGIGLAQNLCDEAGSPIFDPLNLDDVLLLSKLPVEVVQAALQKAERDPLADPGSADNPKA